MNLGTMVTQLRRERARVARELERLDSALAALNGGSRKTVKRVLSASARKRIAAAQKKRWAAWKAKQKKGD